MTQLICYKLLEEKDAVISELLECLEQATQDNCNPEDNYPLWNTVQKKSKTLIAKLRSSS